LKKIYNMSGSVTVTNGISTQAPFSHDGHQTKTIGFGESDLAQWQILNNLPQVPGGPSSSRSKHLFISFSLLIY
jgi:hypothetical protein